MATAGLFIRMRLYLALVWLRFCNWIVRLLRVQSLKPVGQFFHKVVIIGDDFAAGLGDYVTMGKKTGLAQYLESAVARSDKVRHKWEIVNAGIPGSTSSDWLFSSPKSYFNNVFNKQTGDAEIVIVILGSSELRNDPSGKASEVSRNLASICDTLRKKGKQVCVATVASPDPLQQEAVVLPVNSMLEEYCTSTKGEDSSVVLGPRLDTFAFRRETALAFDGFHLNSTSYKLLARNTADFLIPMMTAIEWKTWKNELHKVEYDKALYD